MDDTVNKYYEEAFRRVERGFPLLRECCEYCRNTKVEQSATGYRVCASCGAPMPEPMGWAFGVPVYDAKEFFALVMATP